MGTPEFAVEPLARLIQNNYTIIGVVTATDKPAGRGKKIQKSAVKLFAEQNNILVLQPENLKDPQFVQTVVELAPNLIFVVAFRMLPKVIWEIPTYGTCNLHASLLPQYRGAAPINWAIVNGETETGLTTFFINEHIDTGHIIAQEKVTIPLHQTAGELYTVLMNVGADLLVKTAKMIESHSVVPVPQEDYISDNLLKSAPKITKEICRINWNNTAQTIYNHIRGFSPYPAAWFLMSHSDEEIICKIFFAEIQIKDHTYAPGTLLQDASTLLIACADGFVMPTEIQIQGKKRMSITECLRGFSFASSTIVNV